MTFLSYLGGFSVAAWVALVIINASRIAAGRQSWTATSVAWCAAFVGGFIAVMLTIL